MRFDAPLFFANAETLVERVDELRRREPSTKAVVLDLETVGYVDLDGAEAVGTLAVTLRRDGVHLFLARLHHDGRAALTRAGVDETLVSFHDSVRAAVAAAARVPEDDDPDRPRS